MFENFRERLHTVQQDLTTGLKTLGDKTKESKSRRKSRLEESLSHFSAGQDLLGRFEESWFLLHKKTKDCGQAAEAVDGDAVMLTAHWEKRRSALTQLQQQLQSLPAFIGELDAVTASIAHLEGDFEEMESRLEHLEMLCCRCEQQTSKQHHADQLDVYKKHKRRELEVLEAKLHSEHVHKVATLEQTRQTKLKERQKVYEEAFHQDLQRYRSTGYLHRQAPEASVGVLEQMTVTNLSDQEALDDFLNSVDDDTSTESSLTSGPDPRSCSDKDSECVPEDERDGDGHMVQSDEEDVQPDMTLVGLRDAAGGSDDSDCAGDVPSS